jgi:hypothetical protein
MRFHPGYGKIDDQSLPEEAYFSLVYLLNGDVVGGVESGPNLAKVIAIGL